LVLHLSAVQALEVQIGALLAVVLIGKILFHDNVVFWKNRNNYGGVSANLQVGGGGGIGVPLALTNIPCFHYIASSR
jgi:hypothetical protein